MNNGAKRAEKSLEAFGALKSVFLHTIFYGTETAGYGEKKGGWGDWDWDLKTDWLVDSGRLGDLYGIGSFRLAISDAMDIPNIFGDLGVFATFYFIFTGSYAFFLQGHGTIECVINQDFAEL